MHAAIIAPVVALVAWTLVMQIWLYAVRFPAMRRAGLSMKGRVGSRDRFAGRRRRGPGPVEGAQL